MARPSRKDVVELLAQYTERYTPGYEGQIEDARYYWDKGGGGRGLSLDDLIYRAENLNLLPRGGGRRGGTKRSSAGRSKPKRHAKRRTLTRLRGVAKRRGYGVLRSSMAAGFRGLAERENIAANKFYDYASSQGFTDAEARKILKVYLKHRVIKIDAVNGSFHVKHGAFLDRETMENALR